MNVISSLRRFACLLAGLALGCAALSPTAHAQSQAAFEYDPYRMVIWVAVEPCPQLPADWGATLANRLANEAEPVFGAPCRIRGLACPAPLNRRIAAEIDRLTLTEISAADAAILDADKLLLVALQASSDGGYRVAVRELDCRSRSFGEAIFRNIDQAENLPGAALAAMTQAFAPMVRIELVNGAKAVTRLRAGGLLLEGQTSPAVVSEGELLQPVIRRNDRRGEPRAGGIQRLPFTFLEVEARTGHRVECAIHTGVRDAIAGRGGRTERLALRVRPDARGTRLVLEASGTPPTGLVDYEVLTRPPASKAELSPLGLTDHHGSIHLPLTEEPLRYIYVRHGQTMLARVPIVPGLASEQKIKLSNDDLRLLAESYFLAMQHNVMDLVARREVLAARIRLRLEKDDVQAATEMLTEMRSLASRADLLRQVEQQQTNYESEDKRQQAKVDKMFVELRKLLAKHLDPRLIDELTAEVRAAGKA